MSVHSRALFFALFGIAAVLIFAGLGIRGPWPPDEPRFAQVAAEMVNSGKWLFPTRGGEYYPDKPPVFMWAIAILYKLTGNLHLAVLLPSALCSLLTWWVTYRLSRLLWGGAVAVIAAAVLLLMPQFLIQAKFAQIDAMVSCWIMLGVYGFMYHFFIRSSWRHYYFAWAMMGLGVITKGVGFLPLFLLIPTGFFAFRGKLPGRWQWRAALGPGVMLAVIALWLVPMYWAVEHSNDPLLHTYRNNILFKQTGERYANAWHHIEPWYYYILKVIPVFWLPALLVFFSVRKLDWRRLFHQPAAVSLLAWGVLVVAFFSISPGKRGVYLLPAVPAMAMAAGVLLSTSGITPRFRAMVLGVCVLPGLMASLVGLLALNHPAELVTKVQDYQGNMATLDALGWLCLAVGGLVLLIVWFGRKANPLVTLLAMVMAVILPVCTFGYALLQPFRTPVNVLQAAAERVSEQADIAIIDFRSQYLLYADRPLVHFGFHTSSEQAQQLAWLWISAEPERWLMAPESAALPCFDLHKGIYLGVAHRQSWYLYSAASALPSCASAPAKGNIYSAGQKSRGINVSLRLPVHSLSQES
ncbi:glycosyltransferase family 39 protein [Alteromonas aestuariivivens]|uniref:Glycosyltransferase family 39 protein n=2 Tax=Alteromonas aestuariivivens TaxID=1938339 RepID=A0A3D8MAI4_9ALTE|nr:glycosyltransferase family 39 protein [Alteromonas aestuariivivens]